MLGRQYRSYEEAEADARRFARELPGDEFTVLEAMIVCVTQDPEVEVTVLQKGEDTRQLTLRDVFDDIHRALAEY